QRRPLRVGHGVHDRTLTALRARAGLRPARARHQHPGRRLGGRPAARGRSHLGSLGPHRGRRLEGGEQPQPPPAPHHDSRPRGAAKAASNRNAALPLTMTPDAAQRFNAALEPCWSAAKDLVARYFPAYNRDAAFLQAVEAERMQTDRDPRLAPTTPAWSACMTT